MPQEFSVGNRVIDVLGVTGVVLQYERPYLSVLRDDRREGRGVLFNGRPTWLGYQREWRLLSDAVGAANVEQRTPKRYGPFKPIAKALPG